MKGSIEKYRNYPYQPNIIGIFGFDSPYFGLSSSVLDTGIRKISDTVSTVGNFVSSFISNNDANAVSQNVNPSARAAENASNGNKMSGWGFGGLVLGAAALGYMLYNNKNAREAVRDTGKFISESTEDLAEYKKFLEPLTNIDEQKARINDLIQYIQASLLNGKQQFIFKNYYPIVSMDNINDNKY
ncbi:hypothetical protein PIROE2DRAFT_16399 [Piromyces sp. E2]|nr:hypothetical protein PIROE2DRAFT_16399 [Piromyces sp. E2]|eukprot:OUM58352.1 hypothetical protein PIROE2DRAFT_16399 [Piromyces sp. E2]